MSNDTTLLKKWYRKDNNKVSADQPTKNRKLIMCFAPEVPPESILLPITTHLPHFLNKRMPKLQARDSGIWWGTLNKLQLMLRKASQALHANGDFSFDQMHHYRMAVTEREVGGGCRLNKYLTPPPGDQWLSEREQREGPCHHLHQAIMIECWLRLVFLYLGSFTI